MRHHWLASPAPSHLPALHRQLPLAPALLVRLHTGDLRLHLPPAGCQVRLPPRQPRLRLPQRRPPRRQLRLAVPLPRLRLLQLWWQRATLLGPSPSPPTPKPAKARPPL